LALVGEEKNPGQLQFHGKVEFQGSGALREWKSRPVFAEPKTVRRGFEVGPNEMFIRIEKAGNAVEGGESKGGDIDLHPFHRDENK
jgi:hypothetical protein